MKKHSYSKNLKSMLLTITLIFFLCYLVVLFKIICLKYVNLNEFILSLSSLDAHRPYNIIPFVTISTYFNADGMDMIRRAGNILGNIFIFIPIGLLLPIIIHKTNNLLRILLVSFLFSLSFELIQYLAATGSADIDDILLNTIGGICGYGIFRIYSSFFKNELYLRTISIFTFILLLLFGGWFAFREFKLDLGFGSNINKGFNSINNNNRIHILDNNVVIPVQRF